MYDENTKQELQIDRYLWFHEHCVLGEAMRWEKIADIELHEEKKRKLI